MLGIGFGFASAQTLLTAVASGLFTELGGDRLTAGQVQDRMGWHPRGVLDLLDALVSMGILLRDGSGPGATYANGEEAALFLDERSSRYVGGMLKMCHARLYRYWGDLGEAMRSGRPQNEIKETGEPLFGELYRDPERLRQFMQAMRGFSLASYERLGEAFDFSAFRTHCDVGGATGQLSILLAQRYPDLRCTSFDLPPVQPIAEETIAAAGLSERVRAVSGDFFAGPLPKADVITMGMILHDWNLEKKQLLIRAAYDALPAGGALVAIESLIDDERRENTMGLMASLNMLIEFGDAFDFTVRDFEGWATEVGFRRFDVVRLAGPSSAVIAWK